MKLTVVMTAVLVAATWCGAAGAATPSSAASAVSATSSGGSTSTGENPNRKKYVKLMAEVQKMLDDVQALEDKLPELESKVNDQIRNIKSRDKSGKEVAIPETTLKSELGTKNPSAAAKQYRSLKTQVITARFAVVQKLGPGGAYGKCQELVKLDPKDDTLRSQGDDLAGKVKGQYTGMLRKIATLCEAIYDTADEDNAFHLIRAVDPNDPSATAYFNKKK